MSDFAGFWLGMGFALGCFFVADAWQDMNLRRFK